MKNTVGILLVGAAFTALCSSIATADELGKPPFSKPPPPGFVDFVLPRSLDSTGRPIRVRHGSAIFVERALVVVYDKRWSDGVVRRTTTAFDPGVKVERSAAALKVTELDGTIRQFPASSSVRTNAGAQTFSVIAPGERRPRSVGTNRKPDIIVP